MTPLCTRWLGARLGLALTATLWAASLAPDRWLALGVAGLGLALVAALDLRLASAVVRPERARAWFDAHTLIVAMLLWLARAPLLVSLGAALLPNAAVALFVPARLALPHLARAPLTAALAAVLASATAGLAAAPLAAALAAFLSLRPLAALGESLRALALHRGPPDPLLTWRPLRPLTPGGPSR